MLIQILRQLTSTNIVSQLVRNNLLKLQEIYLKRELVCKIILSLTSYKEFY